MKKNNAAKIAVKALSLVIILLIVAQFYLTLTPCIPLHEGEYSLTDIMWTKTDEMAKLFKRHVFGNKFNINAYSDNIALACALGLTTVVMSIVTTKCVATHIISLLFAVWAPIAYSITKVWDVATLPAAADIRSTSMTLFLICGAVILIRTVIWAVDRFVIPFIKWRKATADWREELNAALAEAAAEEAAAPEAAN